MILRLLYLLFITFATFTIARTTYGVDKEKWQLNDVGTAVIFPQIGHSWIVTTVALGALPVFVTHFDPVSLCP